MKALTLWRPWPLLILTGLKGVENRNWGTTYRGPLLIHAGKTWDDKWLDGVPTGLEELAQATVRGHPELDVAGAFLGLVELVGCTRVTSGVQFGSRPDQHYAGSPWHWRGKVGWVLVRPRPLPQPVPCRGRPGLWKVAGNTEQWLAGEGGP